MNCSWTPTGPSMPACGCGCRAAPSSNSFSIAIVPYDSVERQIQTVIISGDESCDYKIFFNILVKIRNATVE